MRRIIECCGKSLVSSFHLFCSGGAPSSLNWQVPWPLGEGKSCCQTFLARPPVFLGSRSYLLVEACLRLLWRWLVLPDQTEVAAAGADVVSPPTPNKHVN